MYNYYQPQSQQMYSHITSLRGRPVSSIDEVRATSIDFDGSVFYFPDIANKKIYTKQINMDGTSTLQMYTLTEIPVAPVANNNFVTREEFNEALSQIKNAFQSTVSPAPTEETQTQNFNF